MPGGGSAQNKSGSSVSTSIAAVWSPGREPDCGSRTALLRDAPRRSRAKRAVSNQGFAATHPLAPTMDKGPLLGRACFPAGLRNSTTDLSAPAPNAIEVLGLGNACRSGRRASFGLHDARRPRTLDTVIRAGQELPAIRHEQGDDLSDVLGGADTTQRNIPEPIITGKSRSRLGKLVGTQRRDGTGRHEVHTDAARREFYRERARVVIERCLCGMKTIVSSGKPPTSNMVLPSSSLIGSRAAPDRRISH